MHTVCETHSCRRAAKGAGMDEEEIERLVDYLAEHPMAGEEMPAPAGVASFG